MTGNRCGHDPQSLRLADSASARLPRLRGKRGKPPILGEICAAIERAAVRRVGLESWHRLNASGRRRRTEACEQLGAVQLLIANDFKLETRRCGRTDLAGFICADADLYARQVSKCPAWAASGFRFSVWRLRAILRDFLQVGYIRLSNQQRRQNAAGNWEAGPKVILFTRKFFKELGGDLWQRVEKEGSTRLAERMQQLKACGVDLKRALRDFFALRNVMTPRQAKRQPTRPHSTDPP